MMESQQPLGGKIYHIDVMIVDDHAMFSQGLANAVNDSGIAHVSRVFSTLESCRQTLAERRPDVLLLDITLPDGNSISLCEHIIQNYPKIKIIIVTGHDEYSVIKRALESGVDGYLLKSSPIEELIEAIRRVWQGERYISPAVNEIIRRGESSAVFLTPVEQNILKMICDGHTNPEIGESLCLSTETVNWYRKRLLAKYGVKNTVSLVSLVLKEKLV